MQPDIKKMIADRREAQILLYDTSNQLEHALTEFKGTVLDALRLGLVKPAFATSPGFKEWLRKTSDQD